ncbi:hypothetical protein [uncultured Ruegeria sp.]|uniref:hypothetical protein n=1 Tax=uncultured Ruegeria sp. TaxID=259304 RepID=UPI0026304CAF|nr:hypothetical protein [uncultured Ruegeria sp.]
MIISLIRLDDRVHHGKVKKEVVDWLKTIENRSARQTGSPVAEYDFSWMRDELGLPNHRK